MSKKSEKILTQIRVEKLGLDKLSVITADMLYGYTSIGDYAFQNCQSLVSIDIPNGVTNIGWGAFECCISLTSVTIPNSVTRIENWAFSGCSSLTSVTIPNSVTSIGSWAFSFCSSLTSITILNSVTSIGSWAFSCCSSLTSVTIPNSVTRIGIGAFYGCNFKQEKRIDKKGRIIAYKVFNADMTCRDFRYKEGETYELDGKPILCERGFHACLNPLDCLNYYSGRIGKDVVFHEVYLEGVSDKNGDNSKVVAKKITIGREISLSEMADIASGREM